MHQGLHRTNLSIDFALNQEYPATAWIRASQEQAGPKREWQLVSTAQQARRAAQQTGAAAVPS